jgi:hypothetical protein
MPISIKYCTSQAIVKFGLGRPNNFLEKEFIFMATNPF